MPLHITHTGDVVDADGGGTNVPATDVYNVLMCANIKTKPNKVVVRNATIVGDLNCESAKIDLSVEFRNCVFNSPVNFEQATAKGLYFLDECKLHGIYAGQLQTTFNVVFENCEDCGGITLTGAHISGQLVFKTTTLRPSTGRALIADGLIVDQDMACCDHFHAEGGIRLVGARIGGQFRCTGGATFHLPGDLALEATGLNVAEDVYWSDGVAVCGGINLTGCHIGGNLNLTNAKLDHVADTPALDLARATIDQNMICRNGSDIIGKVLLGGAKIGGNLWCEGGRFHNANNVAIDATGLTVGRDVAFSRDTNGNGFLADGEIILSDATIGGSLHCTGGELRNPGRTALTAKGLTVTRDVSFRHNFVTDGQIDLADATIGGRLDCTGGRFNHPSASLTCDRIKVTQSVQFGDGCYAAGTVSLQGAQITADVTIDNATLATSSQPTALTLRDATVGGKLHLGFAAAPTAAIDLCWAKVGQLDDAATIWPEAVHLEGFAYGTIPSGAPNVADRLAWLRKNPRYVPQIYLQLASVYQAAGSDRESTTVAIAGEDARRRSQTGPLAGLKRALGLLLKWTVQYGYRPLQVLWYLVGLEVVGAVGFLLLQQHGTIKQSSGTVPTFNAFLYTLDLLVPVASLGQRSYWIPVGPAVWVAAVFTIAGWVLAACLVVGVGRIFKSQ